MAYMRMQESRFWGWVITSLIVGLCVGLLAMYLYGQMAAAKKIDAARAELSGQVADANAKAAALETRLASSEASAAALAEANAQLTEEIDSAKADAKEASSESPASLTVVSREIQPDLVDRVRHDHHDREGEGIARDGDDADQGEVGKLRRDVHAGEGVHVGLDPDLALNREGPQQVGRVHVLRHGDLRRHQGDDGGRVALHADRTLGTLGFSLEPSGLRRPSRAGGRWRQ